MEDDIIDAKTGKPRRHDGRDAWAFVTREAARALGDLGPHVAPIRWDRDPGAPSVGGYALLVMERKSPDAQGRFEGVWVEVTGQEGERWEGVLDNQPTWIRGVSSGDKVAFGLDHVMLARGG
ncbi:MAG: DUF2314 domain-containing protein [Deltaproteobacteria bacterium]|jgi:hypothetical protein|nr:DUF2314 domain-containing protein [Deltaproteobacteria bacterium]